MPKETRREAVWREDVLEVLGTHHFDRLLPPCCIDTLHESGNQNDKAIRALPTARDPRAESAEAEVARLRAALREVRARCVSVSNVHPLVTFMADTIAVCNAALAPAEEPARDELGRRVLVAIVTCAECGTARQTMGPPEPGCVNPDCSLYPAEETAEAEGDT